jgi:hypothetical protein
MTKAEKITFWISTIWISFGVLSGVILQFIQMPEAEVRFEL